MKQFKIISLSSKQQFLVQDKTGSFFQFPIEGFRVSADPIFRHHFDDFIGQNIECTLNKAGTHIRYMNEPFLSEKLAAGALEVVPKQLEQSKIYSANQKAKLNSVKPHDIDMSVKVVNLVENRRLLLKYFPSAQQLKGRLEYLSEEIVLSIHRNDEIIYVPFKLRNINILFEYLPAQTSASLIAENPEITVKLERPIYNLVHKRFELLGQLDPQIELSILKNGWGVINSAALAQISTSFKADDYLKAQADANQKHIGVFSRNTEILSFIYAKNNFVGEISDVFDGYIFQVVRKPSGEKQKIELAMVRCPIGDQVGAFNCREYARKQLIGEEVNVYLHKDSGLNITGSLIRARDSKDVESMMIEQGWGFVREEFINSILCLKLVDLQKKSREKMRGLYSKDVGVQRPEDLTVPNTHKEEIYVYRRQEVLKMLNENEVGVLDGMFDVMHYRVWLQAKNIVLKVRLFGVVGHNINPLLEEVKAMKETSKQLYEKRFKKRSVTVNINEYQKDFNTYIGTITFQGGRILQEILLEESLLYCDRQNGSKEEYKLIEKKARSGGKGLWSQNLINFEPINPLDLQSERFRGKFSWVEDGETVFIQPQSNYKTLDRIASDLRHGKLNKAQKQKIVVGSILASPYQGDLYRVLIISVKGKKVKVSFVDWGNRETVGQDDFWELPEELKFIEKQCLKVKLYLTRPVRSEQYLQRLRGQLMDGDEYQFKKEKGEYISSYRNKQYINLSLIEKGLVKGNTEQATPEMKAKIQLIERNLCRNKIGVWEWSDEEEDNNDEEDD